MIDLDFTRRRPDAQQWWDETAEGMARAAEEGALSIGEYRSSLDAMTESSFTVEVYRSRKPLGRQRWRWRARSTNGKILATSGEAYANRTECEAITRLLFGDEDT